MQPGMRHLFTACSDWLSHDIVPPGSGGPVRRKARFMLLGAISRGLLYAQATRVAGGKGGGMT